MSHTIFIHNKSDHDQVFEVHGWNNDQNIKVRAHSTSTIPAPDGTHGAIIALHDGHEGEQAEINKKAFGGNDFIDLSNIVGAGGNLTVMQVGDRSTLKGDPNFMQDFNDAWKKASQPTRDGLADCVHVNGQGAVVRIDPIKEHPKLETFVRSFANGMTYIGVGAWGGSPGNPDDNQQVCQSAYPWHITMALRVYWAAGKGSKDILITYNDGNAWPDDDPKSPHPKSSLTYVITRGDTFWSISQRFGLSLAELTSANPGVDPTKLAIGQVIDLVPHMGGRSLFMSFATSEEPKSSDHNDGSPGIILTNKSNKPCTYYFYDNLWNGNGTAGANFDKPLKHVALAAGATQFVPLPTTFKGRVQRGTLIPSTWAEFQISADNDHSAHGDISVEQGNDGGAWIRSTDGRVSGAGFTGDVQTWGPPEAYQVRSDGVRALASTMGNWLGGPNQAAIDAQKKRIGGTVYVTGGEGVPDVGSRNRRLAVEFY